MNEQRLAEIEAEHDGCEGYVDTMELVAEVRRLRVLVAAAYAEGSKAGPNAGEVDWLRSKVKEARDEA